MTLTCRGSSCPFKPHAAAHGPARPRPGLVLAPVPERAAALRRAADADDQRRRVDLPHLHLHRARATRCPTRGSCAARPATRRGTRADPRPGRARAARARPGGRRRGHVRDRRRRRSSTPARRARGQDLRLRGRPRACASRASATSRSARRTAPARSPPTARASSARRRASTAVLLDLGDGDDVVAISASVTLPVTINGDGGNDGLFGGCGHRHLQRRRRQRQHRLPRRPRRDGQLRRRQRHRDLRRRRHAHLLRADRGRRRPRRRPPPRGLRRHQPGAPPGRDRHPGQRHRRELRRRRRHRPRPRPRRHRPPAGLQRRRRGDPARRARGHRQHRRRELRHADRAVPAGPRLALQRLVGGRRRHPQRGAGGAPLPARDPDHGQLLRRRLPVQDASGARSGAPTRTCTGPFGNAVLAAQRARRGADHAREPDRAAAALPLRTPGQPTVGFLCLPPGGGTRDC